MLRHVIGCQKKESCWLCIKARGASDLRPRGLQRVGVPGRSIPRVSTGHHIALYDRSVPDMA
eukprot:3941927-Rhodomonas_salina.1